MCIPKCIPFLPQTTARLHIDGKVVGEGKGEVVLGHPVKALTWMANQAAKRTGGLRVGDVVATGTCTGVTWTKAGDEVMADFESFGRVRFKFV